VDVGDLIVDVCRSIIQRGRWMIPNAAGCGRIADHDAAGCGRIADHDAAGGLKPTPVLARHGPFMGCCHRRDIIG
jgi:hypothetical protein